MNSRRNKSYLPKKTLLCLLKAISAIGAIVYIPYLFIERYGNNERNENILLTVVVYLFVINFYVIYIYMIFIMKGGYFPALLAVLYPLGKLLIRILE